uniref:histidine kinase n=1 Tax=Magnetococcus massalia (strain MO-1) TaxID=451514 RepID=A0A1S7LFI1_MAGMO|nr:Putative Histidine kinase with response regulator receiver domain [Candidatus Magnetococcus massalia]
MANADHADAHSAAEQRIAELEEQLRRERKISGALKKRIQFMLDNSQDAYSMLLLTRDISQRVDEHKQMQEALKRSELANQAKSLFLANMSHEIRTPLNTILGMSELLLESSLSREQVSRVEVLANASDGLMALINDILDLSKIEAEQLSLEKAPLILSDLVHGVQSIFKLQAENKGLKLTVEVDPDLPCHVMGDLQRLRQILLNLTGNAVKFTQQGEVKISFERVDSDQTLFMVQDTGIGIPLEQQQSIFSPFQQADSSITRRFGGTGLGLYISAQLVKAMGGCLCVESTPQVGSRFYFSLAMPQAREQTEHPPVRGPRPQARPAGADQTAQALRILLVDDSLDNRNLIQAYLKCSPHELVMSEHGADAVEKVKGERFNLIFMDLQMPIMDGITATQEIRQWERDRGFTPTPIIALTAHAMKEHEERSLQAGCNFHLTKPIKKQRLLDIIQQHARTPLETC